MTRPISSFAVFHAGRPSLIRANALVLGSFFATYLFTGFPRTRAHPLLLIPALLAAIGTIDTARCLNSRRDLHYAGIILCLFMDLLALTLIFFFLLFPYLF